MTEEPDPKMLEREIFLSALDEADPDKRDAVLDDRCLGDAELRARIEELLRHNARDSGLLRNDDSELAERIRKEVFETSGDPQRTGRSRLRLSGSSPSVPWDPPPVEELAPHFDAYRLDALLGRGGMGVVYQGLQISLERRVAIKILRPDIADDETFARRFRREALSMAQLSHPNLVSIIDFGSITVEVEAAPGEVRDGTLYYLVMEFVEGRDLHQIIRSGHLDYGAALPMISQICDALEYAHDRGYVHRDIKPSNIYVSRAGDVKVGDFGLAKLAGTGDQTPEEAGPLTLTGYVVGTPDYLAPERCMGDDAVDRRDDIYSLGVVFYEMLTGELPKGVFQLPSVKVGVNARLDEVVLKAMQSEREFRYQRASEFKKALDEILSENERAEPTANDRPRSHPSTRWWLMGMIPLLLAGVGYWIVMHGSQVVSDTASMPQVIARPPEESPQPPPPNPGLAEQKATDPISASAELPFENSLGMRFVPVPVAGGPTNGATILFSVWETRVSDYRPFTEGKPYFFWLKPDFEQAEDHPVVRVSWDDANDFCTWLTDRERELLRIGGNMRYRLPSDHEWSCAVGIGDREDPYASPEDKMFQIPDVYPWGNRWPPPNDRTNLFGEESSDTPLIGYINDGRNLDEAQPMIPSYRDRFVRTGPVGSFSANSLGLYDLGGNVSEWCDGWFSERQEKGLTRGGCWADWVAPNTLSSRRGPRGRHLKNPFTGFRCVLELDTAASQ